MICLKCLYYYGAEIIIGKQTYHQSIQNLRPDLVAYYVYFREYNIYALNIIGLNVEECVPSVIACITYLLTRVAKVKRCTVIFRLENVAVNNTIPDCPFQIKFSMLGSAA